MTTRPRKSPAADPPLPAKLTMAFAHLQRRVGQEARRRARVQPPPAARPAVPTPVPAKAAKKKMAMSDLSSYALAVGQDPDHFRANPWPTWRPRRKHR